MPLPAPASRAADAAAAMATAAPLSSETAAQSAEADPLLAFKAAMEASGGLAACSRAVLSSGKRQRIDLGMCEPLHACLHDFQIPVDRVAYESTEVLPYRSCHKALLRGPHHRVWSGVNLNDSAASCGSALRLRYFSHPLLAAYDAQGLRPIYSTSAHGAMQCRCPPPPIPVCGTSPDPTEVGWTGVAAYEGMCSVGLL